jgi:four helix bundle protein
MTTSGLERLNCWSKARELAVEIYREVVPLLPPEEKYNLASQIKRAAVSVPANIAVGYGRYYYQSNIQFCYNARGSLEELLSHLIITHDLKFISDELFQKLTSEANHLVLLLNGYIAYLKKTKQGEKESENQSIIKDDSTLYNVETEIN